MASRVKHKRTSTANLVPAATEFLDGEIILNIADGVLYFKNSSNNVVALKAVASDIFEAKTECIANVNVHEWAYTTAGTGAAFSSLAIGTENAVGVLRFASGTVATNRGSIAANNLAVLKLGLGEAKWHSRSRLPVLSDATNTFTVRSGFIDSITGDAVDGAYFRYTHSINGGRWQAVCRNNNAETATDTGVAPVTNTFQSLKIEVNAAGTEARFYIGAALVATITTNIPTASGRETGYGITVIRSVGTASVNMLDVDFARVWQAFTTAR
jgi:hypothetical protein